MRVGNFARSVLGTAGARVLGAFISLVTGVVLARALGPEGRGVLAFVLLIPAMLAMLGNFGIGTAAVYYFGQNKYSRDATFRNLTAWHRLLGSSLSLLGCCAALLIPGIPHKQLIAIACPIVFLDLGLRLFSSYSIANKQIALVNFASISRNLCLLAGCAIAYGTGLLNTTVAVGLTSLATLAAFAILYLPLRCQVRPTAFLPDSQWMRSTITYGKSICLARLLNFANYKVDRFIIFCFLSEYELGLYAVAARLAESIWILPNAIALILFPKITRLNAAESGARTKKVCAASAWIAAALGAAVIGVAYWCIPFVYGERFSSAFLPLSILVLGTVPFSIFKVLAAYFAGSGNHDFVLRISMLTASLNLAANLLLVPQFGLVGAASASAISYFIGGCVSVYMASGKSGFPAIEFLFDKQLFSLAWSAGSRG